MICKILKVVLKILGISMTQINEMLKKIAELKHCFLALERVKPLIQNTNW